MAFAAGKLLRAQHAPTILIVLDRLDLDEQTTREFTSAGMRLKTAATRDDLRRMLGEEDRRGVIVTTIFRFKDAGLLNDRSNIVVFCDEAHRTQEGAARQGHARRAAERDVHRPHRHADLDRRPRHLRAVRRSRTTRATCCTTTTTSARSTTARRLQVITETRLVDLHIDQEALDQAFEEMAAEEGLSDDEKEVLARKAARLETLLKAPERISRVCEDIVEHYATRIAPLGLKALVVAYDRELCVLYQDEIARLLGERGEGWESTVVMTTRGRTIQPRS